MIILGAVLSHFQPTKSASGCSRFSSVKDALVLSDITRSMSINRIQTCNCQNFWVNFTVPSNIPSFHMMVGAAVPVVKRFEYIIPEIEIYGENAKKQSNTCARGCQETETGFLVPSLDIDKVSDCNFLVDSLSLSVKDRLYVTTRENTRNFGPRFEWSNTWCFFAEDFGGSDIWLRQEETFYLPPGNYSLRMRGVDANNRHSKTSAKLILILGDEGQSEEFSGESLDVGECSAPLSDFYEMECNTEISL